MDNKMMRLKRLKCCIIILLKYDIICIIIFYYEIFFCHIEQFNILLYYIKLCLSVFIFTTYKIQSYKLNSIFIYIHVFFNPCPRFLKNPIPVLESMQHSLFVVLLISCNTVITVTAAICQDLKPLFYKYINASRSFHCTI